MLFVNVEELLTVLKLRKAKRAERVIGGIASPIKTRMVKRSYQRPLVSEMV